jgi:hypothetical protein
VYGGIILVTSWVLLVGAAPICRVDFPGNSTGELIVAKATGSFGSQPSAANTYYRSAPRSILLDLGGFN